MNRRQLMKTAAAAAGAAATGLAQQAGWKPSFFDAHQNDTIVALTDLILPATDTPGAKAAQVNRFIDLMLSEAPAEEQRRLLQGLARLDSAALRAHRGPFVKCSAEQQTALLERLDSAADPFFRDVKRRTVSGYYTSKAGVDELNKGGRVPATFGCTHDGKHE